jgi:hypothetical protein
MGDLRFTGPGWTLLNRDVNTIPEFIKARLAAGLTHCGVIYADSNPRRHYRTRSRQDAFCGHCRR